VHARPQRVSASKQCRPGWSADRADKEPLRLRPFPGKPIQHRRLHLIVAVQAQIPVALIIGHDQKHIRLRRLLRSLDNSGRERQDEDCER